jgi:dihydroorotate dehydrogenase
MKSISRDTIKKLLVLQVCALTKHPAPSTKKRGMVYRSLVRRLLFSLPPETAHELALHSLSLLRAKTLNDFVARRYASGPTLPSNRFGLLFKNPVGLAAGFDKDGVALNSLAALGFGFIEAGTVTFHAQPGNPRPRLFRLPQDKALINRAGFNNSGAAAFVKRVEREHPDCVLGVSIGKSKITPLERANEDYLASFELVYKVADYVAVNVSSPNTPQLRDLQQSEQLSSLLKALQVRNRELQQVQQREHPMPLLVKLSPDLTSEDLETIVDVVSRLEIDGIIATNTSIGRDHLLTDSARVAALGEGGLSGAPLRAKSTRMVAELYRLTKGKIPIVGVGGIFSAEDAWEKIAAGASLVQLYTGFIYRGPGIAREINEGLQHILRREGFTNLDAAVGCRAEEQKKGARS